MATPSSSLGSRGRGLLWHTIAQMIDAAALFLFKFGLGAMAFILDKSVLWAAPQVLEPGSKPYDVVEVAAGVAFLGAALSLITIGAFFFVGQVAVASYDHARRWRSNG